MKDRRGFRRFDAILNAQYFLNERKEGWRECIATDICHKGVGIKFSTEEKIEVGSAINLEIFVPTELDPINARGVVRRLDKEGNSFVSGIELNEVIDNSKWGKLCWRMLEM